MSLVQVPHTNNRLKMVQYLEAARVQCHAIRFASAHMEKVINVNAICYCHIIWRDRECKSRLPNEMSWAGRTVACATLTNTPYSLSWLKIMALQWKIEHATNPLRWSGVWIIISVVLLVSSRTTRMVGVLLLCMVFFVVATFVFISHYWPPLL